jgi:hypothetical protein
VISSADEFQDLVLSLAESEANPHRVTAQVLAALEDDPTGLYVALELALPGWVRDYLKRPHITRRRELNDRPTPVRPAATRPASGPAAPALRTPVFSAPLPPPAPRAVPAPPPPPPPPAPLATPPRRTQVVHVDAEGNRRASAKTVAMVDWYTEAMRQSVKVSARKDDWRILGKCTADDLAFMIGERRRQADLNKAMAERFEKLRALLKESPTAVFVEQLPKDVVEPILHT